MNWTEETNFNVEKKKGTLNVTLSVRHIKGKVNYQDKIYTTEFVIKRKQDSFLWCLARDCCLQLPISRKMHWNLGFFFTKNKKNYATYWK